MLAQGEGEFYIPEPSTTVPPAGFAGVAHESAANDPAAWAMGEMPWMGMYQAPVAPYQQADFMQPMIMPMFYPLGAMQMTMGTETLQDMLWKDPQYGMQEDAALIGMEQLEGTVAAPTTHRRSKRGGKAVRARRVEAAAQSEEATEVKHADSASLSSTWTSEDSCDLEIKTDSPSSTRSPSQVDSATDGSSCCDTVFEGSESVDAAPTTKVDPMLAEFDTADAGRRDWLFYWVSKSFWPLALTKRGCRILQKAIDVGTPAYQQQLLENLRGNVVEAMRSSHANYVLQKFIEIMPPDRIGFIVTELQDQVLRVARQRFGCRILQRLVEHCKPEQTVAMIDEVLGDATQLCRHQYGNYVLQHILQHGSPSQRTIIADVVQKDIVRLSKHRVASHVVSCAMVHCPPEDVRSLTMTLHQEAGQMQQLSRRQYGSFVVREANRVSRLLQNQDK